MPKKITPAFLKAYATIRTYASAAGDKPFYASDLGLNGGQIVGLMSAHIIRSTGEFKKFYHDISDNFAVICKIWEWRVDTNRLHSMETDLEAAVRQTQRKIQRYTSLTNQNIKILKTLKDFGFTGKYTY